MTGNSADDCFFLVRLLSPSPLGRPDTQATRRRSLTKTRMVRQQVHPKKQMRKK